MAPASELKKKLEALCELQECTKSKKHKLIKHLGINALDLFTDAAYNIVNSKPKKIPPRRIKALKNHKNVLMYLANPKNSLENKRQKIVKQQGSGFIAMLMSVAIPLLTSLLSKK